MITFQNIELRDKKNCIILLRVLDGNNINADE